MTNTSTNSLKNGVSKTIYAHKDNDLGFTEIFDMPNDAIAIRRFTELCNNEKTPFNKYPDKVELWKLGKYNDVTGEVTSTGAECIIKGIQCIIPKN